MGFILGHPGYGATTKCVKFHVPFTSYPVRKKIRAKMFGKGGKRSAGGSASTESGSTTSKRARPSVSGTDKTLAAAVERAPEPPCSSLSDEQLAQVEIKINRSPVMVLWAAVRFVQPVFGYQSDVYCMHLRYKTSTTALTLGPFVLKSVVVPAILLCPDENIVYLAKVWPVRR